MKPDFYYDEDTQMFIRYSKFQPEDLPNARAVYVTDSNVTSVEELREEGFAIVPINLPEEVARSVHQKLGIGNMKEAWNYCVQASRMDTTVMSRWQAAANLARRVFTRYSQHHAAKGALVKSIENAKLADAMCVQVPSGVERRYWAHGKTISVGAYQESELICSVGITFISPPTIFIEHRGWAMLPMFADLFEMLANGAQSFEDVVQICEKLGIRK